MTTVDETTTVDKRRVELLSDLRVLLNFLEANPDVPLDPYGARIGFCVGEMPTDEAGLAIVEKAAAALNARVVIDESGHATAEMAIGSARYRIFYVPREGMAEHYAATEAEPRGECGECGRSIRLKLDGTVGHHAGEKGTGSLGFGRAYRCAGAGQLPKSVETAEAEAS